MSVKRKALNGELKEQNTVVTSFSEVEPDKENIKPIPQGRSVHKLAQIIHTDKETLEERQNKERAAFEEQLEPHNLELLDDPLEPYLQYIRWIRESFPTGNNNSELVKLLERTTHDFRDDDYYKNEVRYFKIWLEYIQFSDTPREIYLYLSRKKIGSRLSLFYESYASYLEQQHEYAAALDVFKKGVEAQARPIVKFKRVFSQFLERKASWDSSHNAGPDSGANVVNMGRLSTEHSDVSRSGLSLLPRTRSFQVFTDDKDKDEEESHNFRDSFGSIVNKQKENKILPQALDGQKLSQAENDGSHIHSKRSFDVYKDDSALKYPVTKTVHVPGKKTVKYDFNADLFFPKNGEPRTLLEVLFLMKSNNGKHKRTLSASSSSGQVPKQRHLSLTPSSRRASRLSSSFMIGALNDESDTTKLTQSPTMTYFSKQANKEILQMFNQPVKNSTIGSANDNSELDTSNDLSSFITETLDNKSQSTKIADGKFKNFNLESPDGFTTSSFTNSPLRISLNKVCNPFDPIVRGKIIKGALSQLSKRRNYHRYNIAMNRLPSLISALKDGAIGDLKQINMLLQLNGVTYRIRDIFQYDFNSVMCACLSSEGKAYTIIGRNTEESDWTYYVLTELTRRSAFFKRQLRYLEFYKYDDESYLLIQSFQFRSALSIYNAMLLKWGDANEFLTAYFTIQLLRQMISFHKCNFLHCKIMPDNCVSSFEETLNSGIPSYLDISIMNLTDAVDLSNAGPMDRFYSSARTGQPESFLDDNNQEDGWKYNIDYYGLASVIHVLIFGSQMSLSNIHFKKSFSHRLPKNWRKELWTELVGVLLNSDDEVTSALKHIVEKFERWIRVKVSATELVKLIEQLCHSQ
ncbi:hypothetical protein HII13_004770 [Brettanomyces bruxellensis]|nr:hypothetical protein HII13_004770 [Brettanomyces bruxellensis]